MSHDEIAFMPASELRTAIRERRISPVEALEAVLDRIERVNPSLNAFVTVLPDRAREQARAAESAVMSTPADELGALHGIPTLIKDLTPTEGLRTTYGSAAFADNIADTSSLAFERIDRAGAVLVGKTTTPDFGELGVTESTLTGTTGNPWNPARTSGGSSGGSAAAVVAGLGHLSWGSDGGGSIRIPSACCGAVGLKASLGRIPGFGEQQTFEQVTTCGPITRTVADTALLLDVTAGPDLRDPIALPAPDVRYLDVVRGASIEGLRIAASLDLGQARVSADVARAFRESVDTLRALGAVVDEVDVTLPDALEYFVAWWGPEYVNVVEEHDANGWHIPPAVRGIAESAAQVTPQQHYHALTVTREEISREFVRILSAYDAMICPTMPLTAFPHPGDVAGAEMIDDWKCPSPSLYFHRMTEPFSHAGLPALSLPNGVDPDGMPTALQIAGRTHDDATVLRVAATYEAATPWHRRRPA
jgi:Asp-tRNA(Asn)/Glu-tRNA(Gln) amidotransferase A subunit family amidase